MLGRSQSQGWALHRLRDSRSLSFKAEPEVVLTGHVSPCPTPHLHADPQEAALQHRQLGMSRGIFEFLNKVFFFNFWE